MADVHRRMPTILKRDEYERWLDPSVKTPQLLAVARVHKIGGQAMEHIAVLYKVIDPHWVILTARFTTVC